MREIFSGMLVQVLTLSALLALCLIIECVAVIDRYTMRQRWLGIAFNYLSLIGSIIVSWPLQRAWAHLGLSKQIVIPLADWLAPFGLFGFVAYVAILLTLTDFFRYWCHRAEHRWLWRFHAVHHVPTELHVANSAGHPLQIVPDFLLISVPLSLIQFTGPAIPTLIGAFVVLMSMYIHSPIDIHAGPLRRLIVDNRFHRIHHSRHEQHIGRNFGIGLSIWDAMFGTAYWPKPGEWPATGVAGLHPPKSIGAFLLYPFTGMGGDAAGTGKSLAQPPAPATAARPSSAIGHI